MSYRLNIYCIVLSIILINASANFKVIDIFLNVLKTLNPSCAFQYITNGLQVTYGS